MATKYVFSISRQEGFMLNPDDKVVNGVIKGLNRCSGKCPCYHPKEDEEVIPDEDLMCPCKEYRENKHCRCSLYVKEENSATTVSQEQHEEMIRSLESKLAKAQEALSQPSASRQPMVY